MSYESDKPCVACGVQGEGLVCLHHIITRKSRPDLADKDFNTIPVCREHHNEFHQKGAFYMSMTYRRVLYWLKSRGWIRNDFTGKWENEKAFK